MTFLHIASKSKASGFARYFLAAHELSSSRGSNNDEFVNVSSKSVFNAVNCKTDALSKLMPRVLVPKYGSVN